MTDALILAGGVAKGAFTAGVLSVLLGPEGKAAARVNVHSIVAASSGALNGAFAAAVLHSGTEEREIARLVSLWLNDASFGRVFEPSFAGIFELRGASGEEKVMEILRTAIVPAPGLGRSSSASWSRICPEASTRLEARRRPRSRPSSCSMPRRSRAPKSSRRCSAASPRRLHSPARLCRSR